METNNQSEESLSVQDEHKQQSGSSVSSIYQRIRERSKVKKLLNHGPHTSCMKCGARVWEQELDTGWYCFRCGNRGYWRGTGTERTFVQGGAYGA